MGLSKGQNIDAMVLAAELVQLLKSLHASDSVEKVLEAVRELKERNALVSKREEELKGSTEINRGLLAKIEMANQETAAEKQRLSALSEELIKSKRELDSQARKLEQMGEEIAAERQEINARRETLNRDIATYSEKSEQLKRDIRNNEDYEAKLKEKAKQVQKLTEGL